MINLTMDNRVYVRESFLSVFVYLPIVFGNKYKDYVKKTVKIVSKSLSEENEKIRNLSIKSLKMIIKEFFDDFKDFFIDTFFE